MPTGNRFSRFVSISLKTFSVTMSFIRRQSYKKTLEFACLLGKKWLIKKNVDNTPLFTRRPTQPPCSWRGTPGVGGGGGRGRRSGLGDGRLWGLEPYLFRLRKIFCGWCCKLAIQPRRSAQDSSAWVDSCLRAMLPKGTDDGFFLLSFFFVVLCYISLKYMQS